MEIIGFGPLYVHDLILGYLFKVKQGAKFKSANMTCVCTLSYANTVLVLIIVTGG